MKRRGIAPAALNAARTAAAAESMSWRVKWGAVQPERRCGTLAMAAR